MSKEMVRNHLRIGHPRWGVALLFGLPLLLGGCGKIKGLMEQAAESAKSAQGGSVEVRDLSAAEFPEFTANRSKVVVVDFHAEWCGPCKVLGPELEKVASEFDGRVVIGKVDVDQAKELAGQLGVRGIPDVRIFRGGVMIDQFTGAIPASEIRTRLDRAVAGLPEGETPAAADGEEVKEPAIQPMKKDWRPPGIEPG